MRYLNPLALLILILPLMFSPTRAQQQEEPAHPSENVVTGSLFELRGKRRVLLLVRRSAVVDTRGQAKAILAEVFKTGKENAPLRFPRTYNTLARKLNNYMRKHQSISAARSVQEAEFIVLFNLLEFRRPLGVPHAYGELFVILNETTNGKQPRIIWKTRKTSMWVEDAIDDFLKDLKSFRQEG